MPASGRSLLSEQQDKSPCSLLPRGSAQQLPFCQTLLSQLPKQSGPRWEGSCKTPGENSREPLIQTHSSLCITELKNSLHTGLGFASRHTFYRMEIATEMIFMFYFRGTRGWSPVKRTIEMEGKDKLYLIFKPVPLFSSSPFCWTFNSTFVKIQQSNCLNFFFKYQPYLIILTSKLFLSVPNTAKVPHLV